MIKKILWALSGILLIIFLHTSGYCTQLTILHTNDTHSHIFPFGNANNVGGIARMSTRIRQLKRDNQYVLTVNSGDVFVGTFAFNKYLGYPELKMMERMYDVMCLGNHELDLGPTTLAGILSGQLSGSDPVYMPILCANIDLDGAGLTGLVRPYMIKNLGPFRIGLFGVVTTDPYNYSDEVNALLSDPYKAALKCVKILRRKECNVVICLSHLGLMADFEFLSQVPGIDIIVGGHSHDITPEPLLINDHTIKDLDRTQDYPYPVSNGGTIIVQAGEYGKYLGELTVNISNGVVDLVGYDLHSIDKKVKKDIHLLQTLNNLKLGIQFDPRFGNVYNTSLARAAWNLEQDWEADNPYRDTALGNLVADALYKGIKKSEIVLPGNYPLISLEALGYIGHRLYKGKVVGNDILRSVPYGYDPASGLGFKINVVLLAGAQILAGLEYSVSNVEYTDDLSLQSANLTYEYDSSKPALSVEELLQGKLSRIDPVSVKIKEKPIDPQQLYWVALSEQLHAFLKSLQMQPFGEIETGLYEYNLVKDYAGSLGVLRYKSEGRIIDTAINK